MKILLKILKSIWYYVKVFYLRMKEEDILFMSSGLSFNGILCLIPLLLLLTSLLGIFLSSDELALKQLNEVLNTAFPSEPYATTIKETIQQVMEDTMNHKTSYGLIGMGILLWTATSLFSATRTILNRIYRSKSSKLVILTILEDLLWVVIVGVLFIVTSIFPWLMSVAESLVHEVPSFGRIDLKAVLDFVPSAVSIFLTFLMFFILYRFVPDYGVNTKTGIISSIATTILWIGAGKLFGWYLAQFHSFTKLYGTYAFMLVFIVWIYYSSVVFIVGAIIGQLYKEQPKE
ncbi:MAG: YihY/virulence factor BrkB family protein [Ignavibacteriae bacterium]|nr:YihY/virulence factor BrkB family protein [Ignavibacteriota bacterium]